MKPRFFIPTMGALCLLLLLNYSCSKDNQGSGGCTACPPPPPTRTVFIDADNWVLSGNGFYKSDFGQALKDAAGDYNSIVDITVISNTSSAEIVSENPSSLQSGQMIRAGTTLLYRYYSGQLPFRSIRLKAVVN